MDNDLMARRLRAPSQPNSGNGQQPTDQPGQPSPWDVSLSNDGQFARADADVRRPEYEPRNSGGRASMPEPEYIWGAPPDPRGQQTQKPQGRPRQGQPAQPTYPPQPVRNVAPPPSAWLPAPQAAQPQQPQNLDWDLPQVAPGQPMADPPAPWSTSAAPQHPQQSPRAPYAPAPTWAMTEPTPNFQPEPPRYMPPPAPQYQQPPAPQYPQLHDPFHQSGYQPAPQAAWPPAQQPFDQPTGPQHMPQPMQSAPVVQSAPAADPWVLNNQPAAATAPVGADVQEVKANSLLTAGLTIGFALLVIVLVLVFIQLMTSLLR